MVQVLHKYKRALLLGGLLIVSAIILSCMLLIYWNDSPKRSAHDFESCAEAGNAVSASSPERCYMPDGTVFTKALPGTVMNDNRKESKIRVCPDEWYQKQVPAVRRGTTEMRLEEYFIVNDSRDDASSYDLEWIKSHCKITSPRLVRP